MKKQLNEKISLQKLAGIINELDTPDANVHPWIINSMQELKDSLELNLDPQKARVDFDQLIRFANNLVTTIRKYR